MQVSGVQPHAQAAYPREKKPPVLIEWGLDGPQRHSGRFRGEWNLLLLPGLEPRIVHP